MVAVPTPPADRSTADLVKEASELASRLVRDELRLARLELRDKGRRMGLGVGLVTGGGLVAFYGVGALVAAAVLAVALVLPAWLAALIVGVALLAVAGVLALIGRWELRRGSPPLPEEALDSLKRDVRAIREKVQR